MKGEIHVDSPAAAARLIANVTRGGGDPADPLCAGCVARDAELARLRRQVAGVTGERDRLRELLGGRGE